MWQTTTNPSGLYWKHLCFLFPVYSSLGSFALGCDLAGLGWSWGNSAPVTWLWDMDSSLFQVGSDLRGQATWKVLFFWETTGAQDSKPRKFHLDLCSGTFTHSHWRNQITWLSGKSYFRKTDSSEKRGGWLFAEE